jgi:hypothetical protein
MIERQLELGFEDGAGLRPSCRRRGRTNRANWWFEQMRGVVKHARDWPAAEVPEDAARPAAAPPAPESPSPARVVPTASSRPRGQRSDPPVVAAARRWKPSRRRRLMWE